MNQSILLNGPAAQAKLETIEKLPRSVVRSIPAKTIAKINRITSELAAGYDATVRVREEKIEA